MASPLPPQPPSEPPPAAPRADQPPRHDVFITYRRSDGTAHALALRDWLLRYRLPRPLRTHSRHRPLTVYLDEVYVRASNDFFRQEIAPALRASGHLLVVHTPGALAPGQDGGDNWVEQEIREFRAPDNPRGDRVLVALAIGSYGDPLPGGLDRDLPRVEKLAVHDLPRMRRWWPPARLRVETELLPLVAALFAIPPEEMPALRREAERRAFRRLVQLLSAAVAAVLVLGLALAWALASQVRATRSAFAAADALVDAQRSNADTLASLAAGARSNGDLLGAARLLAEARSAAWTPRVAIESFALPPPTAIYTRRLDTPGWPLAFSPDGRLAVGGFDGSVALVDPATGRSRPQRPAGGIPVVDLAFDDAGRLLVVARSPADSAWNAWPGAPQRSLLEIRQPAATDGPRIVPPPPSGAHWLSIATDRLGRRLLAGAEDGAWLVDPGGATPVHLEEPEGTPHPAASVAVSANGRFAAASTIFGQVRVWDLDRRALLASRQVRRPTTTFPYNNFRLAFSPDGQRLLYGSFDGSLHSWRFLEDEGDATSRPLHRGTLVAISLSRRGDRLATGSWDGTVALTSLSAASEPERLAIGEPGLRAGPMAVALSPDGRWLAASEAVPQSSGQDPGRWLYGTVRIWEIAETTSSPTAGTDGPWWYAGFDRSGRLLSAAGARSLHITREDRPPVAAALRARPWTPLSATQERRQSVRALTASATASGDASGIVGEPPGRPGERLAGPIAFAPAGDRAAVVTAEVAREDPNLVRPVLNVVDVATGRLAHRVPLPLASSRGFGPLAFAPDRRLLVSLIGALDTPDGKRGTRLWSWQEPAAEPSELFSWEDHRVVGLAVHPEGRLIALADDLSNVVVIDAGGEVIQEFEARLCCLPSQLAFAPDGRSLVAAQDAQIRWWEIDDGWRERSASVSLYFKPTAAAFTPTGRLLVLGDQDASVRFYDPASLEETAVLDAGAGPIAALEASPDNGRLAVIGTQGLRLLGGALPATVAEAERRSRLTVRAGVLALVDPSQEEALLRAFPQPPTQAGHDPAAAHFFSLLRRGAIERTRPATWLDWLRADSPLRTAPAMSTWLEANPSHPLAQNPLQWTKYRADLPRS